MKYFLTGATGFVGGRTARQLVAAGHEVIAIVRSLDNARHLEDAGITLRLGNITDKASLRPAMEGVDGVFHLAAWYKVGAKDTREAERTNVEGTRNVLEVMRELGIPKGVYTSTLAVFSDTQGRLVDESYHYRGPFLSEYDRTKWVAHYEVAQPLIEAGLPLVIVQPGVVYGPGDTSSLHDTFVQYLQGRLRILPAKAAVCWGHVDDTAQAHIQAMQRGRPGEAYIIAGPPHTFVEAFALAEKITGIPAPKLRLSPATMKLAAKIARWAEKYVDIPAAYRGETLSVTAGVTYLGSNEKAKRELGFDPRPLETGLRETLADEQDRLGRSSAGT